MPYQYDTQLSIRTKTEHTLLYTLPGIPNVSSP